VRQKFDECADPINSGGGEGESEIGSCKIIEMTLACGLGPSRGEDRSGDYLFCVEVGSLIEGAFPRASCSLTLG
jgi:hypothetical protein